MLASFVRTRHTLLLGGLLLFTGCLTIEEHYTFKKDGSGTMEYVVDLSEMGSLMEGFSEMGDGSKDGKDPGLGAMEMGPQVDALKALPGISKVKLNSKKKWVQRISFSFKDVAALNTALNELMRDSSGTKHEFFRWEGNTLVRTNNRHAYELGSSMAKGEADPEASEGEEGVDMSAMLESMKYKYSFKFARPIASSTAADGVAKVAVGSKELQLDTDFAVIGRSLQAMDFSIDIDR